MQNEIEILEILKQLPKEAKIELLKNIQMYKIGYEDGVKRTLAQMQKSPQQVTVQEDLFMETTITNTLQVFKNEELNANIRVVEMSFSKFLDD